MSTELVEWQRGAGAPHLPVLPLGPAIGSSPALSLGDRREQLECLEKGWVTGGGECRAQVLLSGSGFKYAHPTQACACLSNLHLLENSLATIPRPDSLWGCPPLDTGDLGTESHKLTSTKNLTYSRFFLSYSIHRQVLSALPSKYTLNRTLFPSSTITTLFKSPPSLPGHLQKSVKLRGA